jgi:hypothetical protein
MSEPRQVWTVMAINRELTFGGHRLGIFESEDEAIACAREKQADPTYNSDTWTIRIDGPRDWNPKPEAD